MVVSATSYVSKTYDASERAVFEYWYLNGSESRKWWYQQLWYVINMLIPVRCSLTMLHVHFKEVSSFTSFHRHRTIVDLGKARQSNKREEMVLEGWFGRNNDRSILSL
jgi:hypothetical protein